MNVKHEAAVLDQDAWNQELISYFKKFWPATPKNGMRIVILVCRQKSRKRLWDQSISIRRNSEVRDSHSSNAIVIHEREIRSRAAPGRSKCASDFVKCQHNRFPESKDFVY